ncbi:MAG: hypothetical protein OJF50_000654 [Nitrospira sp.]|nr:hypothetical protein [Nitrospira sp.]
MEFLFNDLSIHGQFPDIPTFKEAIGRLMQIRKVAQTFGRDLHCHRSVAYSKVSRNLMLPQAMHAFGRDERQVVMQWLTRHGPFWDDARFHGSDDYLECNGAVVTDTAVGEAAFCCFHGIDRRLVSLTPSSWEFSPISVTLISNCGSNRNLSVINHWDLKELEAALRAAPMPVTSWEKLATVSKSRFKHLTFLEDSFEPLHGYPFVTGAANRVLALLDTLNQLKHSFNEHGERTLEGQRLYQEHFTGEKAWFSDSSQAEKHEFRKELTFRHPIASGEFLFCTWHGKVKTPQLRVHFSWPIRAKEPLYVVYVGPKITKH